MTNLTKYEMETVVNCNVAEQTDINKTYFMPKSYVNYCRSRKVSSEQREQARQRMAKLNFGNS